MEKTELRKVKIRYCDFCGVEAESLGQCIICLKEMCNLDLGCGHSSHSVTVYNYPRKEKGINVRVCMECADKKTDCTLGTLLERMLGIDTVQKPLSAA